MKNRYDNIFWGFLLILAAGLTLAQQQGLMKTFTPLFWMIAFGGVGLIFMIRYLVAGVRFWGWLFPACIFTALAGITWLANSGFRELGQSPPLCSYGDPILRSFCSGFSQELVGSHPLLSPGNPLLGDRFRG